MVDVFHCALIKWVVEEMLPILEESKQASASLIRPVQHVVHYSYLLLLRHFF